MDHDWITVSRGRQAGIASKSGSWCRTTPGRGAEKPQSAKPPGSHARSHASQGDSEPPARSSEPIRLFLRASLRVQRERVADDPVVPHPRMESAERRGASPGSRCVVRRPCSAAAAPTLATELVALVLVGTASTVFMANGNSTFQRTSDPSYCGRVMVLLSVTFGGSTPTGGPIASVVCEFASPRAGLVLWAAACLLATVLGATSVTRTPPRERRHPHPVQNGLDRLSAGSGRLT
jgi:Major Facilitator Superfamily